MEQPTYISLTPNLIIEDMAATLHFYTEVLDFQVIASVPESGLADWAMLQKDDVMLMFQTVDSIKEDMPTLAIQKGMAGTFYCKVKHVQSLFDKVGQHANIVVPMRKTFYGMLEFTIQDLNGFYLTFAEEIIE